MSDTSRPGETVAYTDDDTPQASETKPFRFVSRGGVDHLYELPRPLGAESIVG
ncbi:hypothetical protein AB0F11_26485 [Streptomyces sp. NPDC032472]|uniref:hypothetical protein n=1 Tax=Streptomyces sp. NPDC032472 TaxID=3155018 RepID=UPI003403465A